jgi:hypothetical protein
MADGLSLPTPSVRSRPLRTVAAPFCAAAWWLACFPATGGSGGSGGWRLIDESIEPPTVWTPDWAEPPPPAPSRPSAKPKPGRALARAGGPQVPAARQPQGALSGRVVFTNAGHGWVFDPAVWRLQRPVLHEMNEDYGNLDQVNLWGRWWCRCARSGTRPRRW